MILLVSSEVSKVVGVLVAIVCPFSFSCDKDNYHKPFDRDFIGLRGSTRGNAWHISQLAETCPLCYNLSR